MMTIASLEVGQTAEILARLKSAQISVQARTISPEGNLEICEISVEDDDYDRGCDVVEAWYAEQEAARKKHSGVDCKKCGARDYEENWDESTGYTYKCKKCGYEFGG
jgi:hypothetical protein